MYKRQAFYLPHNFKLALLFYLVLTTLYSFVVKKLAVLDIILLASLYTLRVFAGGLATEVLVSPWLLAFSLFIFLSLACMKRYSELYFLKENKQTKNSSRGYTVSDLAPIASFGTTSAYLSVLVLALYINSEQVVQFYSKPSVLWLICPLLLYWVSSSWLKAHRGLVDEDPVIYAIKDRTSYIVAVLACIILVLAI